MQARRVQAAAISAGLVGMVQCLFALPFMNAALDRALFVDFDAILGRVADELGQAAGHRALGVAQWGWPSLGAQHAA